MSLTGHDITEAFADAVRRAEQNGRDRPAYANAVLKYVRDEHHGPVSKTELARELAEATIRLIEEAGSLYNAAMVGFPPPNVRVPARRKSAAIRGREAGPMVLL